MPAQSLYERERQLRIKENDQLLKSLGLKHDLVTAKSHNTCSFYGKHKSERIRNSRGDKGPSCFRQSRRLRGEDPVAFIDRPINLLEDYSTEGSHNEKSFTVERPYKSGTLPKSLSRFVLTTVPQNLCFPLTLCSVGTTILDLGRIYTGPNSGLYWSSSACKFHHPYPVGYKACKVHFGCMCDMAIEEGTDGPVFTVKLRDGNSYSGATPTQPWTQVCVHGPSPGTRVSGPLFFGFSDPIIISLIQKLKNYEPYEEVKKKTFRHKENFSFMKGTNVSADNFY